MKSRFWLREECRTTPIFSFCCLQQFRWQLDKVTAYVRSQPEHHKKMTFEEEFLALLKKADVPYDPKYVFG